MAAKKKKRGPGRPRKVKPEPTNEEMTPEQKQPGPEITKPEPEKLKKRPPHNFWWIPQP